MRRVLFIILATVLIIVGASAAVLTRQAHRLAEATAADANALEDRTLSLPSNREGSLTKCLASHADVAPDVSRVIPWTSAEVIAIASGADLSLLRPDQRAELDADRAWVTGVLRCGELKTVDLTAGIGPFPDFRSPRRQTLPRAMEALTSLIPLSLADAPPDEALDRCASALTLTTAWLRLEGLESMLPLLGTSRAAQGVCGRALPLASDAAKTRFRARMKEVRALAPTYSEMMQLERTQTALRLFGAWFPGEIDARLPDDARDVTAVQRDSTWSRGVIGTLALRLYWKRFDAGMREVEAASTLPPTARSAAILTAQAHLDAPFLKRFFAADPVDLRYQMYAGYLDGLHAALDALGGE